MHQFARFLFITLLPLDPESAYSIGLRAMRLPILEGFNNYFEDLNNNNQGLANNNQMNRQNQHPHHHFQNFYHQNLNSNHFYPFLPAVNNNSNYNQNNNSHYQQYHPYNGNDPCIVKLKIRI